MIQTLEAWILHPFPWVDHVFSRTTTLFGDSLSVSTFHFDVDKSRTRDQKANWTQTMRIICLLLGSHPPNWLFL